MLSRLSLTTRLTLFFTSVAAVVMVGLGLLLVQATEQHFVDLDRGTLEDKRHLIEAILRSAGSAQAARQRLDEALNHHAGLYVLVNATPGATPGAAPGSAPGAAQGETHRGAADSPLFQTPGFQAPEAASVLIRTATTGPGHSAAAHASAAHRHAADGAPDGAPDGAADSAPDRALQQWQAGGRQYRALQFELAPAYDPQQRLVVLAAVDTDHHDHFMAELGRSLLLYVVLAVLACGLLAWLAARQGLAPLRAMRAKAAAVSGHRFSARMPVQAVPIEMADLAAELNAMLDRLQDDYRRLSEFSSDLAHELRTPISNLLTQTQVALSARRDAPTYSNILASNAEELERLARMVADMLFLAKAERGMALPQRERFAAAAEVQALLEFYDAVAEDKGLHLSVAGDGVIDGDRLMFRRAVSNLLSNAVRHGDAGSAVLVQISPGPQGLAVAVENSADDLDRASLPRLFDRFFRGDPSRAHPASEGAGLGLSITKAIVQAHGGQITASSQQRRVRVTMHFPKAAPGA